MSDKLIVRSVQRIVPYDFDLTQADFDEVLYTGLGPYIEWRSEKFARWLHDASIAYFNVARTDAERGERKDAIDRLMQGSESFRPLLACVHANNVAMVVRVFIPLRYVEKADDRDVLFYAAQKTGNLEMLRAISEAIDAGKGKGTP